MFGPNDRQTSTRTQTPVTAKETGKPKGTTYDLCRKVEHDDGTYALQRIGKVFILASAGTGGVVFMTDGEGTRYELLVFPKWPRRQTPNWLAAQPEAA